MFYDLTAKGVVLRVRLTPNSCCWYCGGIYTDAQGQEYLKAGVNAVAEKGKANQELIKQLAKFLKMAKSDLMLISGHTDRCKKILIVGKTIEIAAKLELLGEKEK